MTPGAHGRTFVVMGWFSRKPKDGVRGTAQVISSTAHSGRATHQTCRLNLVVQVDGMQPFSVEHSQMCPASKWPDPGMVVPVIVSRKQPTKLTIDFDAMPDQADVARRRAEQHAAMLRAGGQGVPGATIAGTPQVTIVGGAAADIPPEMRAGLEQMLGVDLDGDGRIGPSGAAPGAPGGPPPPPPPVTPANDRLAQLERLARLRDSGALTEREFEAEKRRLLGS